MTSKKAMTSTGSPDGGKGTPGRVRRIGFASAVVLSVVLVVLLATGFPPMLTLPVTGWLPDAAFEDFLQIFTDEEHLVIHRLHIVGFSLIPWMALIGLVPQLRRPEERQAPIWTVAVLVIVSATLDFTIGLSDPFLLPLLALVVAAVALHPQRLPEGGPTLTGPGRLVGVVVAACSLIYAYGEAQSQILGPATDPHVVAGHYSAMATLGIALAVAALIGMSNLTGRRITAWMTGVMVTLMGAFFIGFPVMASSPGTGWGAFTVALGAAYLFFTFRGGRTSSGRRGISERTAQSQPQKGAAR